MKDFLSGLALAVLAVAFDPSAQALQPVLQRGYDANVDGANLTESTLNTSNVAVSTFGMVFKLPVDADVYAQPLYAPGVAIAGQGTHNVVYVATMDDSLYAFDADTGVRLWKVNFASSVGATPVPFANFAFAGNTNITGNLGILSTPVIDPSSNILYLVAGTLENSTMVYRLHAVDITSGTEPYTNVVISGSYGGVTFDAPHQTQRLSLVLSGNHVVFGFGAVEAEADDEGGYVGWVMAYNKTGLAQSSVFATVTTGSHGGGVWQSGRPPVVDSSGYVYLFTGNGFSTGYNGVSDFSESALKLNPATGLSLVDWFTPDNWTAMDDSDLDLSSSGPLLIPGTSLLAGGGKTGILYVLNTANLGKETATDSGVVQEKTITVDMRGGPAYWHRSTANGGSLLYNWGAEDWVKAYAFNGSTFAATPSSQGSGAQVYPGGILALSANGDTPGSGVLWATVDASGSEYGVFNDAADPGVLHAFDANNVATELWNSTMNSARDNYGNFAKYVPPLVANGRVYVATFSDQVAVYGLLSTSTPTPTYTASPTSLAFGNETTNVASAAKSVTVTNTGTVALPITSITLSTAGSQPFSQTNTCGTSVAVGANCKISVVFDPASTGPATATLSVNAGSGAGTQTVALSGTGVAAAYSASPTSLAFGNETTNVASAAKSVTVTNTGTVALPITSITLSTAGSQPFSQTNTCGTSVAVGANCKISVVFDPASTGPATATLSVNAGSGAGTQTVALSGTGIAAIYSASPTSLAFGNETTNVASAAKSVTVTNTGTVALPITSITLSTAGSQPFSQTNTCGTSVAVGATCTINVVFNPASVGSATATLSVNAGSGAGTQTVALSGTGIAAIYSASPTSLAFGNETTNVASAAKSVTVTNTGTVALPITSITLSTTGSQPFSQTNTCGTSVAVGATCTINVVFNPASVGSATATLSVNAGSGAGTQAVALGGTGVAAAYSASPTSLAFGSEIKNVASASKSVTVTNTGTVALPITSITLSTAGSQPFSQTNTCGTSVAVGATCTISVVFDPASAESATATLSVTAGSGGGTQTVALSGTGVAAIYSASPTSLAYGNETMNVASAPKSVAVTNTGTVALPITSITLSTTGSQPFSQTNNCGTSVAVGATCTISVVFDPASAESATATLSVNAGNGAGAQIVALSGTGIATLPTTTVSSSNSGGGALDAISLLSLLAMFGLQQRRRINARTRVTARRFASAGAGGRNDVFVMQAARQDYG